MSKLRRAIMRAEDGAGTLPAKEAVKLRPSDWHEVCRVGREAADEITRLRTALADARREALEEAAKAIHCDCDNHCDFDEAEEIIRALMEKPE